jgi:hypothetical protein
MRAFGRGSGAVVLLMLLQRMHQSFAARAELQQLAPTPRQPALSRELRQVLLETGDIAGFLAHVRADHPAALLADESNQVRGLWLALDKGPWAHGEPLANPEQSVGLVRALRDAGLLQECEQVAEAARLRWPAADAELTAVRDEVRRELAFEGGLRRLVYQGYQQPSSVSLDQVVAALREQSNAVFGRDVVGKVVKFSIPLIGEMLDPFTSDLGKHLATYNRHLVLGRRSGGTVEGLLLTRLSVRELPDDPTLKLPARCFEVIGENRELRSLTGVVGGDLAGVALLNHYVVDIDAVREWADGIADRRRISAEDGNALLQDPLPDDAGPLEALDAPWRLSVVSPVEDKDLDMAVLDAIRHHERAHLVDSYYFLPVEANLWRGLGLLLRFGFSGAAIEAEMERRAEVASLALSPHTDVVLSHIADFLGEDADLSPHARGFQHLARELSAELLVLGVPAAQSLPCRWHLVDRDKIRAAAAALMHRNW